MLNRTTIEEANKHLQALYSRVSELEGIVLEQQNALSAKDSFIQTKIRELSQQDLVIKELRNDIEVKDSGLHKTNETIKTLQEELNVKNLQITALKEKSKALSDFMNLIPDLKSYCANVDGIAAKVRQLDDDGYLEVSESPSLSDEADNTDGGNVTNYAKENEDAEKKFAEGQTSVREMARSFVQLGGSKKFSVTEDDLEEDEITIKRNNSSSKEVYF